MKLASLYLSLLLLPFLVLPVVSQASAFISIGDSAEIYLDADASVRSSSNLFRSDSSNEQEDVVVVVSPGLELIVGRGTDVSLTVNASYAISKYQDFDNLDNEASRYAALFAYTSDRLELEAQASYSEINSTFLNSFDTQNTAGSLIKSEVESLGVEMEYELSPKFSFGAAVNARTLEYKGVAATLAANNDKTSIPIDLYYELTPKLDLSIGYTPAKTDITNRPDLITSNNNILVNTPRADYENDQDFFNLGLRGQLTEKLNGLIKVGLRENTRIIPNSSNIESDMFGAEGSVKWAVSPKLISTLGGSKDFDAGGDGTTTEVTAIYFSNNYTINANWASGINFKYMARDYTGGSGREDETFLFGLRLSYVMNANWIFNTGYTFTDNDTNSSNSTSYSDHSFDFGVSLRY